MSFVDLMANDIWSEADIIRRTESMIRSEFSLEAETILNRKVIGISLGTYIPTAEDQLEMEKYSQVAYQAQQAGIEARKDMALLLTVFPLEEAQRRLDRPILQEQWDILQEPDIEPIYDENEQLINSEEIEAQKQNKQFAEVTVSPYMITDAEGNATIDPEAIVKDEAERIDAQSVIDNAPEETKSLFMLRNNK